MLTTSSHRPINSYKADILIVDDTIDNIRFLSTLLVDQGYNVRKALNGAMAITAVTTVVPDLILLDVSMPGMSGYEVCTRLKADPLTASIPIIFLSASTSIADKVNAFQVGGGDYITKPFQLEEVLVRIETQLKICHLQKQLTTQNTQLQTTLAELKNTQLQLIQKEKLSSLNQLVAGILHEVNNPMTFISGNFIHVEAHISNLLQLVHLYQNDHPHPSPRLAQAIADLDVQFLTTDLPKLLGSMQVGVSRIQMLLTALKLFAHLGEAQLKLVDLHQGLDSTLMLLEHRLLLSEQVAVQVIKDYGNLPQIHCYGNQLNQVFLNLLNNGIDALQLKLEQGGFQTSPPLLRLQTTLDEQGNAAIIRIQDNGVGIADDLRSRLFDPFFTTKGVGKGLGLGLAISYQIVVEQHHGQLTYRSTPNEGTEFTVTIPLSQT